MGRGKQEEAEGSNSVQYLTSLYVALDKKNGNMCSFHWRVPLAIQPRMRKAV